MTDPGNANIDLRDQSVSDSETVNLYNPNYTENVAFREEIMMNVLMFSSGDGLMMLGRGIGWDYEFLLETGANPIIMANRYSGEDMKNTSLYNPGDIYWEVSKEDGSFYFYEYMGDKDIKYQPDAVPEGQRKLVDGSGGRTETDGMTLYTVVEGPFDPAFISQMDYVDPSGFREKYGIPADDEARTRIFLIHRTMRECMLNAGRILNSTPSNLEDYIDLMGRPNPVAWTNPYTNLPMNKVPWVNVPAYNMNLPCGVESQYHSIESEGLISDQLIGNYSFTLTPSDIAEEMEACLQFYFRLPDGSIASYFSIGPGPLERMMRDEAMGEIIDGIVREGQALE